MAEFLFGFKEAVTTAVSVSAGSAIAFRVPQAEYAFHDALVESVKNIKLSTAAQSATSIRVALLTNSIEGGGQPGEASWPWKVLAEGVITEGIAPSATLAATFSSPVKIN